jgi:transcriptional regulator with XRE-family HTH domain
MSNSRNPRYVALGLRVQRARWKAGVSAQELARRTGYKPCSVRNWEAGRRSAEDKLPAIAAALGLPEIPE